MSTKKAINQEMITKVWKLHKNAVPKVLIAETLGCSKNSVKRIVTLMEAAQNGENIDKILGNSYSRLKKMVKDYFEISEKKEETKPKQTDENVDTQEIPSEYRDLMTSVLLELSHQSYLLERLLEDLGVDLKEK